MYLSQSLCFSPSRLPHPSSTPFTGAISVVWWFFGQNYFFISIPPFNPNLRINDSIKGEELLIQSKIST